MALCCVCWFELHVMSCVSVCCGALMGITSCYGYDVEVCYVMVCGVVLYRGVLC